METHKKSFFAKWKEKGIQKQQTIQAQYPNKLMETEVYEQLVNFVETNDEELAKLITFMVNKDVFTIDLDTKEFLLLTQTDEYVPYHSAITTDVIDASVEARKERITFYEEMKTDYQQKVAEKYEEAVLANYWKEIEEKCRPSEATEWIRKVTTHIIVDDLKARDFIRLYLEKIHGMKAYIDATYPPK